MSVASIQGDTWDQWNQDRDNQIAQQAQQQTSARETSGATDEPGWDDLDANGDWYPVEGYGNVWVPNDEPQGWDPYGNGSWANYPGWGYTWISGYSWGWLPYHCGAWNYWDSMGWGWIPGQCGLGWRPTVDFWNTPRGWRPPPRPIPGGHIGPPNRLIAVNHGPALPNRGITNTHTQPVRIEGQRVDPLPVLENPNRGGVLSYRGTGTHTMPVGRTYGFAGNGGNGVDAQPRVQAPIQGAPGRAPTIVAPTRPVILAPQRIAPPAPRPVAPAPRTYSPPPAPRVSAPPPAPHVSAPAASGHR
jgi:hypothetical protein